MPDRSFGRMVRYRRTKLGLSQAKLGELVGRSPSTIRSWERDRSAPTESAVLHALAAILGVDEATLFEKAGQDPPPDSETRPTVEEALATLSPQLDDTALVPTEEEEPEVETSDHDADFHVSEEEPSEADSPDPAAPAQETADQSEESNIVEVPPEQRPDSNEEETVGSDQQPGYVAPPEPYVITAPTPRVVEPSYMEDTSQKQLYRVRNLATLVVVVALVIAFLWAFSEGLNAIGSWWDDFFGSLRL